MKTKPGMSSLNEDDVRRIIAEFIMNGVIIHTEHGDSCDISIFYDNKYIDTPKDLPPATDTETPASQASSEVPAEEGTPPWQERRVGDRRKIPEPKLYK